MPNTISRKSGSLTLCGIPKKHPRHTSAARRKTSITKLLQADFAESVPGAARRPNQTEGGRLITNLSWGRPSADVCHLARRAAVSCAVGKIKSASQFLVR